MALRDLTDPDAVEEAIEEFQRVGRDKFLSKYGFGRAAGYFIRVGNELLDSKAVAGAAHGYQFPRLGPLKKGDFSGGEATVKRIAERSGVRR